MVCTIDERSVDLHVERNATTDFFRLLSSCPVLLLHDLALCQNFFDLLVLSDFSKTFLSLLDESKSERREADLSDSSVVQDLCVGILSVDEIRNVQLQEQFSSLLIVVVDSKMVDLEQVGSNLQPCLAIVFDVRDESGDCGS